MPVNFKGKPYKTVAERLNELNSNIGRDNYSLNTDIITLEDGIAVTRSVLTITYKDSVQTYSGLALEKAGSSFINNTSHLENAETSSIGRCLAAAGWGGTEFASADELANALANKPNGEAKQEPEKPNVKMASEKQKEQIEKLVNSKILDKDLEEGYRKWLKTDFSSKVAEEAIIRLEKCEDKPKAKETK